MTKIVFPEIKNPIIQEALEKVENVEAISAEDLEEACGILREGKADGMIAGIDYTSRDVILAAKNMVGMEGKTFTSSIVFQKGKEKLILADIATVKNPDEERLFDIVLQTFETAKKVLDEEPRIAILSFSTFGSGGKDESIKRAKNVVEKIRRERPEIIVDGEMQLDAAIDERIGKKKASGSKVAGRANVLIAPDLNSGNILYKAIEHFGGYAAAGPILQGFRAPISDLSRGSNVGDVILTIETLIKIIGE